MPIKIGRAGKLIEDNDGFIVGKLSEILETETQNKDGNKIEQYKWIFKVQSTKGETEKSIYTCRNINPQKTYNPEDEEGKKTGNLNYNTLTQVLLNIEFITLEQLHDESQDEFDIEELIGKKFKFKINPDKYDETKLGKVDISSISLIL